MVSNLVRKLKSEEKFQSRTTYFKENLAFRIERLCLQKWWGKDIQVWNLLLWNSEWKKRIHWIAEAVCLIIIAYNI